MKLLMVKGLSCRYCIALFPETQKFLVARIKLSKVITALASATGGRKHPLLPGAPGRRGVKPPDSIEQEVKPPVQWKVM